MHMLHAAESHLQFMYMLRAGAGQGPRWVCGQMWVHRCWTWPHVYATPTFMPASSAASGAH